MTDGTVSGTFVGTVFLGFLVATIFVAIITIGFYFLYKWRVSGIILQVLHNAGSATEMELRPHLPGHITESLFFCSALDYMETKKVVRKKWELCELGVKRARYSLSNKGRRKLVQKSNSQFA